MVLKQHLYIFRNKVVTISASNITVMTLEIPNMPKECDDRTKKDIETLMVDPVSRDIYLAQKNERENDVTLYKVHFI